jgi:hypothetical protein
VTSNGLTVLLTNFDLSIRGGSQLYLRDVALGLVRRGHHPFAYSPVLGAVAGDLRRASIPVVDNLDRIDSVPDVIHGHHNHDLMTALLRYPEVPAIRLCHGSLDDPPARFPRILRYVAVDDTTRDRCRLEWGIPETQLTVLLNFVDLDRFTPRAPLPARPARALVFSNNAREHLPAVRHACSGEGISVDAIGDSVDRSTDRPELMLGAYDLVFAKGRAALESIATGAAVVLCDASGVGPMVTSAEFDRLRSLNFGLRALRDPVMPAVIAQQIRRYDANDAAAVSRRLRAVADAGHVIDRLVDLYHEVICEHARSPSRGDLRAELIAASSYLNSLGPRLQWAGGSGSALYFLTRRLYHQVRRLPLLGAVLEPAARPLRERAARRRT